jgi:hypothetical protein
VGFSEDQIRVAKKKILFWLSRSNYEKQWEEALRFSWTGAHRFTRASGHRPRGRLQVHTDILSMMSRSFFSRMAAGDTSGRG